MKKVILFSIFLFAFQKNYAQNKLIITNSSSATATNITGSLSGNVVYLDVVDPTQDAEISVDILTGGVSALASYSINGNDLYLDGNGIDIIEIQSNVSTTAAGNRKVTIVNAGLVHFQGGCFSSSGGYVDLIIGNESVGIADVGECQFSVVPNLNNGIFKIIAGTIDIDVNIIFPAYSSTRFSQCKTQTWDIDQTTGVVTFQTFVPHEGDKMICSPMSNGFTNVSASVSSGSVTIDKTKLYTYDATDGNWDFSPSLTDDGIGYFGFVGSGSNTTGEFLSVDECVVGVTGTPNVAHIHSLGYYNNQASTGSGAGWNLIGNPFPASLDWSTVTLTNVNDAIYVWNPETNLYNYYVSGTQPSGTYFSNSSIIIRDIPPMQSFWVQATQSGATISTTSEDNTSTTLSTTVYKSFPDNLILSIENNSDSLLQDALWIKNVANTSLEFEGNEDAWKFKNPNKPSIYTTDSLEEGIAINSIDLSSYHYIPFTIETHLGGTYTLDLEEVVVNPNAYQVYLLDTELNTTHDFSSGVATISLDSATVYDDRFALFATTSSTVGLDDLNPELDWTAVATSEGISVSLDQLSVQYELIDINGRTLSKGGFDYSTFIPVESAGVKILRVWCAEGSSVKKFNVIK